MILKKLTETAGMPRHSLQFLFFEQVIIGNVAVVTAEFRLLDNFRCHSDFKK